MKDNEPPKLATNTYLDLETEGITKVARGRELEHLTGDGAWRIVGMYLETRLAEEVDHTRCRQCGFHPRGHFGDSYLPASNNEPERDKFLVSEQFFVLAKGTDAALCELQSELRKSVSAYEKAKRESHDKGKELEKALELLVEEGKRSKVLEAKAKSSRMNWEDVTKRYRRLENDMGKIRKEVGAGRIRQILCIGKDDPS